MGFGMGLNLLLLLAMVSTNILSLYHLSSSIQGKPPTPPPVPDHLLHQLTTIRATINHLRSTSTATPAKSGSPAAPTDLLLYSQISPIGSACHRHPDLLHRYMNYTPFSLCPSDLPLAESLLLRGCHPLPRRRCFSPSPSSSSSQLGPKDLKALSSSSNNFFIFTSELDLTIPQLLQIAKSSSSVLRLALDIGAGSGTFAAQLKPYNVTVLSTTMNLGFPFNEAAAFRGVVPLHVPLQQRLPIFDGVVDLVRCGHAVNRWIPLVQLEFLLYDVDRVLRGGGYLWLDRFFCKGVDLDKTYAPLIGKLGYKRVKWATASKTTDSSKNGDQVYLTALLQKPAALTPKS